MSGYKQRSLYQSRVDQPGRGGCVDRPSLLMEKKKKTHNVSSVHSLTLEASQQRTKPPQSSCPNVGFWSLLRFL